jgi:ATP-dependent DNA ligase
LQSKAGKLLTRYFPDIVSALLKLKAQRFVLDGELVISIEGSLSFEPLLGRMNPSARAVKQLAREHPALFFVFDLLSG